METLLRTFFYFSTVITVVCVVISGYIAAQYYMLSPAKRAKVSVKIHPVTLILFVLSLCYFLAYTVGG